jgi:hypothetical protein
MSDPKDKKRDELSEEQLASASGGRPPDSPKPPIPHDSPYPKATESELTQAELDKASGGAGPDSPFAEPVPPKPPVSGKSEAREI